jgi:hypothetical protein
MHRLGNPTKRGIKAPTNGRIRPAKLMRAGYAWTNQPIKRFRGTNISWKGGPKLPLPHGELALVTLGVRRRVSGWCAPQHVVMGGPQAGLGSSALDFSDGLCFQDWVFSKFNRPINLLPGNFDRHEFFLVVSFGRCSLRLCTETVGFLLQSFIGDATDLFRVSPCRIGSFVSYFLARMSVSQFINFVLIPAPCSKRIRTYGILVVQIGSLNGSVSLMKNQNLGSWFLIAVLRRFRSLMSFVSQLCQVQTWFLWVVRIGPDVLPQD